jgi:probable HAF family extracellular repeat protein
MIDLGDLPGGNDLSGGDGINSSGHVTGQSSSTGGSGNIHTFLWKPGTGMQDIGNLQGIPDGFARGGRINDNGQIAGQSGASATVTHAYLWSPLSGMQDLGDLPGGSNFSSASDLNSIAQVVGYGSVASGTHAFLWTNATGMLDLQSLIDSSGTGWTLAIATGINEVGQIVGYGTNPNGDTHGFLLTPVPEPSAATLACGAIALMLLGGGRRLLSRKNRIPGGGKGDITDYSLEAVKGQNDCSLDPWGGKGDITDYSLGGRPGPRGDNTESEGQNNYSLDA